MATGRFTVSHHRRRIRLEVGTVPIMGIKTERRAAREPVSPHQRRSWPGCSATSQRRSTLPAGEIDACTVDETVHHYHRDAGELWKFCFSRGGGSHAEFVPASSTA
jgi:hypothetical protein